MVYINSYASMPAYNVEFKISDSFHQQKIEEDEGYSVMTYQSHNIKNDYLTTREPGTKGKSIYIFSLVFGWVFSSQEAKFLNFRSQDPSFFKENPLPRPYFWKPTQHMPTKKSWVPPPQITQRLPLLYLTYVHQLQDLSNKLSIYVTIHNMKLNCGLSVWENAKTSYLKFSVSFEKDCT